MIKVEGSTINPSDRYRLLGHYSPVPLPAVMGVEGVGTVIEAKGADIQQWIGKRVSFTNVGYGTWAEYSVSNPNHSF